MSRLVLQAKQAPTLPHYRVLLVGAGAGGLSVASQLRLKHRAQLMENSSQSANQPSIALIDPSEYHYYQPLWTLVGGGVKEFEESRRPMTELVRSVQLPSLINQSVRRVDPIAQRVELSDDTVVGYDYLVLSPGVQCRWERVKGLSEALADPDCPVSSNYHAEYVQKTARLLKSINFGPKSRAIFTQPSTPIKCAGAPQKIMYLAEEIWHRDRKISDLQIEFFTGAGKIFAVDKYAEKLAHVCNTRNIQVNCGQELVEVDGEKRHGMLLFLIHQSNDNIYVIAIFKRLDSGTTQSVKFSFLHATPPMAAPEFIAESGLGNNAGFVDVNPKTLQHTRHKNIFALGDASSVPTSKTAAAVAAQCGVVAHNLAQQIRSDLSADASPPVEANFREYDGYTSCPLVTGRGKLILAEFNGFTLEPRETFWFDQGLERSTMYTLKSNVLPVVYWDGLLKGVWDGPSAFRKYLNPLNRN